VIRLQPLTAIGIQAVAAESAAEPMVAGSVD
jgi:hypothetical protein